MKKVHIAVGTLNPCKIDSVKSAFTTIFPTSTHELVLFPYSVPSGVADQPFGDSETKQGAINRARGALTEATKNGIHIDFSVGLEGGIDIESKDQNEANMQEKEVLWCMAYMCVIGTGSDTCTSCKHPQSTFDSKHYDIQQELIGIAKTASFALPDEISRLVLQDKMELGDADDQVFQRVNSKQGIGTVGMLTKSIISRSEYYKHALILALTPFVWPEHYMSKEKV
jgi:non-canonical (house-cleaning) NTP pyrophosphatase